MIQTVEKCFEHLADQSKQKPDVLRLMSSHVRRYMVLRFVARVIGCNSSMTFMSPINGFVGRLLSMAP